MTEAIFTESLGSWMVRQRRLLSITQLALAVDLGVKRSTVSAWERGERTVSAFHHARMKGLFEKYAMARQVRAAGSMRFKEQAQ